MANLMKLVLSCIQYNEHNKWSEKAFEQQTKPAVLRMCFLQSKEQHRGTQWTMFDYTAVHLPFYTTSSPQNLLSSNCCASSVLYAHSDSSSPMLLLPLFVIPLAVLLLCVSFLLSFILYLLTSCLHFSSYYILCLIHIINPFKLLSFISYTGLLLPCPCQSLCEFYANHCARIEALRRQLQEEQRGRQVEHTATAGLGWYCSWDILCTIKSY